MVPVGMRDVAEGLRSTLPNADETLSEPLHKFRLGNCVVDDIHDDVIELFAFTQRQVEAASINQQVGQQEGSSLVAIYEGVARRDPMQECRGLLVQEPMVSMIRSRDRSFEPVQSRDTCRAAKLQGILVRLQGIGEGDPVVTPTYRPAA